ncbi:MAG: hypothetical protein AAF430_23385 [Myxococcota bacterium]
MSEQQQESMGSRLRDGWMRIAGRFGSIQTLVLLGFFYFVLIGPVSIVQALARRDQLDKRPTPPADTSWKEADSAGADLERAKLLT